MMGGEAAWNTYSIDSNKKIASSIYDSTHAWRDNVLTLKTCTGTYRKIFLQHC
jgi:hypothetical protein